MTTLQTDIQTHVDIPTYHIEEIDLEQQHTVVILRSDILGLLTKLLKMQEDNRALWSLANKLRLIKLCQNREEDIAGMLGLAEVVVDHDGTVLKDRFEE